MKISQKLILLLLVLLPLLYTAGCSKTKKKKTTPGVEKTQEKGPRFKLSLVQSDGTTLLKCEVPEGGRLVTFDINRDKDKNIDIWKVYRANGTLACREMDLNFDGSRDLIIKYYDNGKDPRGIWQDQNFNGKFDIVLYIRPDGTLEKTEMDTNSDGKIDLWKEYRINRDKENVVFSVTRDLDHDGYKDYWERYDETGVIDEISWTDSGDNSEKPRYWMTNPAPGDQTRKETTKLPEDEEPESKKGSGS